MREPVDEDVTDEELIELRDASYELAHIAIKQFLRIRSESRPSAEDAVGSTPNCWAAARREWTTGTCCREVGRAKRRSEEQLTGVVEVGRTPPRAMPSKVSGLPHHFFFRLRRRDVRTMKSSIIFPKSGTLPVRLYFVDILTTMTAIRMKRKNDDPLAATRVRTIKIAHPVSFIEVSC